MLSASSLYASLFQPIDGVTMSLYFCARRQYLKLPNINISYLRRRKPLVVDAFPDSLSARPLFVFTPAYHQSSTVHPQKSSHVDIDIVPVWAYRSGVQNQVAQKKRTVYTNHGNPPVFSVSALFGLIGIIIFGAKVERRVEVSGVRNDGDYRYYYSYYRSIEWGYALAAAGSILVLLCSGLVAYSRVKHAAQTKLALETAGVHETGPTQPAAASAPFTMPMQPMMPGQPMQMPPNASSGTPAGYYPYPSQSVSYTHLTLPTSYAV